MRLAVIRQRYTPFGGAERFLENALQALLERNVTVTLYTREWNASSPHAAFTQRSADLLREVGTLEGMADHQR